MTDLQDPLPENSFKWRRWFTWLTCLNTLVAVGWIIWKIQTGEDLKEVAFWLLCLNAFYAFLYMVAPSAVDAAKIVASMKLFREQPDLAPNRPYYRRERPSYRDYGPVSRLIDEPEDE